jgi:hypothetical protein
MMGASPLISEFWSRVWDIYRENREPIIALLTLIGGAIAAVATAWFTLRQARIAKRRDAEQTNADQQRKITEIITNAVEQLGSKKIQVRLGGIYMLEHISRGSVCRGEVMTQLSRTRHHSNLAHQRTLPRS